jgi:hypothetical protein
MTVPNPPTKSERIDLPKISVLGDQALFSGIALIVLLAGLGYLFAISSTYLWITLAIVALVILFVAKTMGDSRNAQREEIREEATSEFELFKDALQKNWTTELESLRQGNGDPDGARWAGMRVANAFIRHEDQFIEFGVEDSDNCPNWINKEIRLAMQDRKHSNQYRSHESGSR